MFVIRIQLIVSSFILMKEIFRGQSNALYFDNITNCVYVLFLCHWNAVNMWQIITLTKKETLEDNCMYNRIIRIRDEGFYSLLDLILLVLIISNFFIIPRGIYCLGQLTPLRKWKI